MTPPDTRLLRCDRCASSFKAEGYALICSSCGRRIERHGDAYAFIEPPKDAPVSVQTTEYGSWSRWRQANYHFFKAHLPKEKKRVLDIGAGPSQFRDLFTRHEYVGVDFYPYEQVSIIADCTKPLPLRDESFDIVVLSNVLEHMPDPEALLAEARRLLVPGGLVLATVPFLVRVHQEPYDYGRYTSYGLARFCERAGFTKAAVEPLGHLVDTHRTIERHFFDELRAQKTNRFFLSLLRLDAAVRARITRTLFGRVPASLRYTEGFGVVAKR